MRTSVIVIAHDEERHISQCIKSLLQQTKKADEIVVIVHNSTDRTELIARSYPVIVIPFSGPAGITYARLESLRHVTGDIILCIDGDSYAAPDWIEVMTEILIKTNSVLVGSWVKFRGTLLGWWSNLFNYFACMRKENVERWIWGSSMAFWGRDRETIVAIFEKSIALSKQLGLSRNPDDYWLALFMKRRGNLAVTNKTVVTNYTKELSNKEAIARSLENMKNGNKMKTFFATYKE